MEPAQARWYINCGLDDPVFESRQGQQKMSCPRPNRPGWMWVSARLLFSGYPGSFPRREVDNSPPSKTADRNEW